MKIKPQLILKRKIDLDKLKIIHTGNKYETPPEHSQLVEETWSEFLRQAHEKGMEPWDGTYYRIENIEDIIQGSNEYKIGTIKYSQLKGITRSEVEISSENYLNHIPTGSFIKTTDNKYIFGKRGVNMNTSASDFIGGGLQPDELEFKEGEDLEKNVKKEMIEEANISSSLITQIECLGIVISANMNVIFIFFTDLNITSLELIEVFKGRTEDEMADLVIVEQDKLKEYLQTLNNYSSIAEELLS